MSYASDIKREIVLNSQAEEGRGCCALAELSALMALGGSVRLTRAGLGLRFANENAAVTRRAFALIRSVCGQRSSVSAIKRSRLNLGNIYVLDVSDAAAARALLEQTGLAAPGGEGFSGLRYAVPDQVVQSGCCQRAYLRGAFLAGGTISAPGKGYYADISSGSYEYAESLARFLSDRMGLGAKLAERRGSWVVYIKNSESIIDFLSLVGSSTGVFELENTRIMKGIYNDLNRAMNCDAANSEKTLAASQEQTHAINRLIETDVFRKLHRSLRETAELRLENPDATIQELGQLHNPPVSKSCVNHRLVKLRQLAAELDQTHPEAP